MLGENVEKRMKTFVEIVLFRFITMFVATAIYVVFFMIKGEYSIYYRILAFELLAAAVDISWFFQGLEEFKKTVIRNIAVRLISVTLIFVFVNNKEDLITFVLIYSLADFIGNLSLWLYLPKYFKGQKVTDISIYRHLIPIFMLFVPQISNQIYNSLDKTMIGKIIIDKNEVGYYEQAQKVIRLLITLVTSLGVVMIPKMANTFANGDKEKIKDYLKRSFNFVFFLSFPLMFGIISISKEFVPIFFGRGYDKTIILINIISPIVLLMGVANVIGTQYLLPTKKQKEYTFSVTIGLVVNFILNLILINLWDSVGASIATVLSQLVVDLLQLRNIRNDISLKDLLLMSSKYFISGLIMFLACYVVKNIFDMCIVISLIVQIFTGAVVYISMLVILKDDFLFMFLKKGTDIIKSKLK